MSNPPLTLPTDEIRYRLWRFADRTDLQTLVQRAREVARGPVARLVANGARRTHQWTPEKNQLLETFFESGIAATFVGKATEISQPSSNLARGLIAYELAWVDGGAATSLLAHFLALSPIATKGTTEQKQRYVPLGGQGFGNEKGRRRGAFCLTEPLPHAGADASVLGGKVHVAQWESGREPILRVRKDGRFITNMAFANFVVAAVESGDERIRGSCLVILEENDPGLFDHGTPTRKMAHQLSSTADPRFDLQVPASRILGGYTVEDGVILPSFNHGELIEPVIKRSRVIVGILTSAKLLSAVEPLIRYHRGRFRRSEHAAPGTPKYELGLQQHQDVLHRVVDIWACGEAGASLAFAAARAFDRLDSVERQAHAILGERGISGRGKRRIPKELLQDAIHALQAKPASSAPCAESRNDVLVRFVLLQTEANVLAPAVKLWNTGVGTTMLREVVSLIGGYGITEDCPGFLGYKWVDAQLEATYEGPEAVQRRSLAAAMEQDIFPAQWKNWIDELFASDSGRNGSARILTAGMELWFWTYNFLRRGEGSGAEKRFPSQRQEISFPLADSLCWLLAARQLVLDVYELAGRRSKEDRNSREKDYVQLFGDLACVQSARAAGEVTRICGELVLGDEPECGKQSDEDPVVIRDKSGFLELRATLEHCLAGTQMAKRRAAEVVSRVTIPPDLDYPR